DRADVGEEFQVVLEPVEFARGGRAHRALRALQVDPAVDAATLADAIELAEAAFEDRLQAADLAIALGGAGVKLGQLGPGPEAFLETVGFAIGAIKDALLAENDHPGGDRAEDEQQQDELYRQARVQHQGQHVDAVALRGGGDGFDGLLHQSLASRALSWSCNAGGIARGLKLAACSAAMRTLAASGSSPSRGPPSRRTSCANARLARRHSRNATVATSASSSRAG